MNHLQLLKDFPELYSRKSSNKIYSWHIYVAIIENKIFIITEYGYIDGKQTKISNEITTCKSQKTINDQAIFNAQSKWNFKVKKGFKKNIANINEVQNITPMLAQKYCLDKPMKNLIKVYVQPKLDGWRCYTSFSNSKLHMKTRNNTQYPNNFPHIVEELHNIFSMLPSNIFLDGELFSPDIPFQSFGLLKKDINSDDIKRFQLLKYHVFDCVDINNMNMSYQERYKYLQKIIKPSYNNIKLVNTTLVKQDEIKNYYETFIKNGMEGIIIRDPTGKYEINKRSRYLKKYKEFDDDEFEIVDFIEGDGKYKGTVIWVVKNESGQTFKVTPKGTLEYRKELYENGNSYIGKMLQVIYFGKSLDGIPRFPIGKCIRKDI